MAVRGLSLAHALNMRNTRGCRPPGHILRTASPKAAKVQTEKTNFLFAFFLALLVFLGLRSKELMGITLPEKSEDGHSVDTEDFAMNRFRHESASRVLRAESVDNEYVVWDFQAEKIVDQTTEFTDQTSDIVNKLRKATNHTDASKYQSHGEAVALQFQLSLPGVIDRFFV
jgi:hypothetical protein